MRHSSFLSPFPAHGHRRRIRRLPFLWVLALLLVAAPLSAQGEDLVALERLAEDSFAQDDLASAVALYRQLAARHESLNEKVRVMTTVAWLEHLRGQAEAARETLTEVLVLDPAYAFRPELYNDSFTSLFYDAQKMALDAREAKANRLVREGAEQLRSRDYSAARASFKAAIDSWAEQPKAIYNLALVDYYEERYDEALAGFEKVLALAAARPELVGESLRGLAATNLGLLYLGQGQDEEAARLLEEAVRLDGKNATAWSNLAITRRRLGDTTGAAVAARKAFELAPDDTANHRSLGLALLDAGRPAEAAELLRESTRRFPEDAGLWLYLGLGERRAGTPDAAAAALRRAVDRDAGNAGGWAAPASLQLAALAYERADDRAAVRHAEQTLVWRPTDATAWSYVGLAKKALRDLEGAREGLEKARTHDPTQAETHNSLGSVLFELGRLDEAEAAFRQALAIDSRHAEALRNLEAVGAVRRGEAVVGTSRGSDRRRLAPPATTPTRDRSRGQAQTSTTRSAPPPPPPPPKVIALGWRFSDVDYASLGLQGVMVEAVDAGTPAGRAGIQAEDLLLRIDGRSIESGAALEEYIRSRPAGSELMLELLRQNRPLTLRLEAP